MLPMSKETVQALKESIEHWHEILDMVILNHLARYPLYYDIEICMETCPLCWIHYKILDTAVACERCPVTESIGMNMCRGSPWKDVAQMLGNAIRTPYGKRVYEDLYWAVAEELEFLYSLLDDKDLTNY